MYSPCKAYRTTSLLLYDLFPGKKQSVISVFILLSGLYLHSYYKYV